MSSPLLSRQRDFSRSTGQDFNRDLTEWIRKGRSKTDRPVANNTRLFLRGDGTVACRYHSTDVITIDTNGVFRLNSGGWKTSTTKERTNSYLPRYLRVYQKDYVWYLSVRLDPETGLPILAGRDWDLPDTEMVYLYEDGITIDGAVVTNEDGQPIEPDASYRIEKGDRYTRTLIFQRQTMEVGA